MSSTVEQIKERLNIADVVSSYIQLEKAGGNFKARCPFHNEKTPSFFVSPSRQTYHCFGCDRGGDMFSFVQEIEGLDFPGALKVLADRAGVEIKKNARLAGQKNDSLYEAMEEAAKFFERNLKSQDGVISYLKKRGLTGKTAQKFGIGYAANEWSALRDHMKSRGYTDEIMDRAGIVINGDRGYYDRFRGRIMFPIPDSSGRIVGFSGRVFGTENEKTAKYVNSPETELYNKSKVLYGFDKAKVAIRKAGVCILVEGQMDLLMSHQAGFENTVAVSGTALTPDHLRMINRLAEDVVFAFDSDDAGVSAARRGAETALSMGMNVKIVPLPHGTDPAEFILKDASGWGKAIDGAQHIIDFSIHALAQKGLDQRTFRVMVGEVVLPYIAQLKNRINQAHFVSEVARKLGIAEDPVWEELRAVSQRMDGARAKREIHTQIADKQTPQSHILVGTDASTRRKEMLKKKILGVLFWQGAARESSIHVEEYKKRYASIVGQDEAVRGDSIDEEERKEYMFEAEIYYEHTSDLTSNIDELLKYLEEEVLKEEFALVMNALREAENREDADEATRLLQICQRISKKINSLK